MKKKIFENFTVMVGDLVHSRKIGDRLSIQRKMHTVMERVSKEFEDEFYAPLVLTRGIDEFSSVLRTPKMSYRICRFINEEVHPYHYRTVIVRGILDVAIPSQDASQMDGPAFHQAADMMKLAKKKNLNYLFYIGFPCEDIDLCLNEMVNLIHIQTAAWTDHQRRVVQLYKTHKNQKAVAEEMGITQQAVSDALLQAHWKDIYNTEGIINRILEKYSLNK